VTALAVTRLADCQLIHDGPEGTTPAALDLRERASV